MTCEPVASPSKGSWRVYSSGAGIAVRLIHECFLGLRRVRGACDELRRSSVEVRAPVCDDAVVALLGRPRAFHAGKINAKFSRDAARNRRRFYARFLGLWWRRRFLFFIFRFRRLRFFFLFWFFQLFFFWFFRFRLFLFFFFLFSLRRFLALAADKRNSVTDVYLAAFFDVNLG